MVVSCGEGIWVCVGNSVRVVWYACRVSTSTYCVVCASLYVYVVCVVCVYCAVCACCIEYVG